VNAREFSTTVLGALLIAVGLTVGLSTKPGSTVRFLRITLAS
jgi:hypothetical protein